MSFTLLLLVTLGDVCAHDADQVITVQTLYRDAPILLAKRVTDEHLPPLQIDGAVVSGDQGLLQWHAGRDWRIDHFVSRSGLWWLDAEIWIAPGGHSAMCCGGVYSPGDSDGPTPTFLGELGYPSALVANAAAHLPLVKTAAARAAAQHYGPNDWLRGHFHGDGYDINAVPFTAASIPPTETDGFQLSFNFGSNDAPKDARLTEIHGRKATQIEKTLAANGRATWFVFGGTVTSVAPVHFGAGSTVTIWFPFVVKPADYRLEITGTLNPITSNLAYRDPALNTICFRLPAFTAMPGSELSAVVTVNRPTK